MTENNPYIFTHESVDAVTITDADGNERTYVDAERIAQVMLSKVAAQGAQAILASLTATDEQVDDVLMDLGNVEGQRDAFSFLYGFAAHLHDVSGRIRQGLPAHEWDEVDPETVESEVQAFADALAAVETPDDLTGG